MSKDKRSSRGPKRPTKDVRAAEYRRIVEAALEAFDRAHSEDDDDLAWNLGYDSVRQDNDAEAYAEHATTRASEIGVLFTAAEEIADVFGGEIDDGDTVPALGAVIDQWRHAADVLAVPDRLALRLRTIARELEAEVNENEGFDPEYVTELIGIADLYTSIQNDLAGFRMADEVTQQVWWRDDAPAVAERIMRWLWFVKDLDKRQEDLPQAWTRRLLPNLEKLTEGV